MTPDAITRLFKEAYDSFPPLEGKPTDNDLLAIREARLPLLMVIPYDQLNGIHSLTAILTQAIKYEAEHGNYKFVRPSRFPLYDKNIADDATTVVRVRAEAAHKARLDDYTSYEAAERGVAKFLRDVVNEIWYNDLKDAYTFYTKVSAINIMALLDANSGGLHAVDMISLHTNMMQYYVQVDGIPQFIVMMEDAQKKAKRAGMLIADVELVMMMMALAAVLAAQHFLHKVDDWEGLPAVDRTWRAWRVAFRLAHLKRQRKLQAAGGGEPLCSANSVLPAPAVTIDRLGKALDNLALAAANDTTVLQQLTAANLALTTSNALLTAANKKLSEALAKKVPATTPGTPGTPRPPNKPFPGNYCWTHGHRISQRHTSATCGSKAAGHMDAATASNTMGG